MGFLDSKSNHGMVHLPLMIDDMMWAEHCIFRRVSRHHANCHQLLEIRYMMHAKHPVSNAVSVISLVEVDNPMQERRKEFAKQASKMAEDGKVAIR